MSTAGVIVAATDWGDHAAQALQRAAHIGAQCGARGLLVHIAAHGWAGRLRSAEQREAAADGGARLEQLAQQVSRTTGFAFSTLDCSSTAAAGLSSVLDDSQTRLIILGQRPDAWFGNRFARSLMRNARHPVLVVKRRPEAAYRRVLVAVDCSEQSAACIVQARALAPDADMVVVFALSHGFEDRLHCVDAPAQEIRDIRMKRHEDAFNRVDRILEESGVAPHQVVKIIEHAYAPKLILDTEREFLIDLLVLGRSNASLLRRCFFRGVASQVLAQARGDVLIVPDAQALETGK